MKRCKEKDSQDLQLDLLLKEKYLHLFEAKIYIKSK